MNNTLRRLLTALIAVGVGILSIYSGFVGTIDKNLEDTLYHHGGDVNDKIKIIKIDDRTMNKLGDFSTWSRDIYAKLVETICVSEDVKPAVIGFDILFSNEKDSEADLKFAEACEKYGNVVTGYAYVFKNEVRTDEDGKLISDDMAVDEVISPYEGLANVTESGFVNALMDENDSIIRSSFLYFDEKDGTRNLSFSAKVFEKYMKSTGKTVQWPTEKDVMGFTYSGKPGDYENVSLIDVIEGKIPPQAFDDCIVLVGAYAAGMMDAYFVPVDKSAQMYGVEIHANAIEALMEGNTLDAIPQWLDSLIATIIIVALVIICEKLTVIKVVITCFVTAIVKLLIGLFVFNQGYSGNVIAVPLMAVIIAVYYVALHYYKAKAAKRSVEKAFNKYVAPQVVDEISKDGSYELKLGGENRDVAVLFVDIRGFTPLSESLEPEQVVDILNGYLHLTTESIFRHGGTLDKFIGDATMAVFNSPFDTEDYVYKAILAAWDIVQGGNKIEKEYLEKYGKSVGFGVGINCGPAVVGNIGCEFRMDYTAIGDTVNTAARLEANAPKGKVYISEYVYEAVKDRIEIEEIGEIPLKGKSKGVFVYSVTKIKGYVSVNE